MTTEPVAPLPIKILCVDDEENILRSLERLFIDEEFEVLTVLSGEEGLRILAETPEVGVIISDQRMPGMFGSEFLEASCSLAPDAVRILLTGYSDLESTIDAINLGGTSRYISKPWDDEELLLVVRDAVKQYTLIMENRRLNEIVRRQNEELLEWNTNLKRKVLQQTASLRLKNEELHQTLEQLKDNIESTVLTLAGLVKLRGKSLFQHACTVAELSMAAARYLAVHGEGVNTIRIAALLHDIGKISIAERILLISPDKMNFQDLKEYRLHTVRGQLAIDAIEYFRPAGRLIRHHHENFDGSGFPDHLAAGEIPLGARIIAFADFLDTAMTGQANAQLDEALTMAEECGGTRLDPSLQRVFEKVAAECYGVKNERSTEKVPEKMVLPSALQDGMILSRNVYSGSGVLLLKKGTILNSFKREAIERYYDMDPVEHGVYVCEA